MKFRKYEHNPILKPNPANQWEERCVLNPAVIYDEENEQFFGRTYADSPDIDGRVWIAAEESLAEGSFVKVCIDGLVDGDLSGYLLEE